VTVAFFRKKQNNEGDEAAGTPAFAPQPDKARKWFDHARTSAESSNYDYALSCYANGIKLDPSTLTAHDAMYDAAIKYVSTGGKPATGKEVKSLDDGTPIGKFAAAEFEWLKDLTNFKLAQRALEASIEAGQREVGHWMSGRFFNLLRQQKRPSKGQLVKGMELLRDVGAWEQSMQVGEMARNLDPADNDLAAELKNLAAQRAMDQGGYERAAGKEGGFRQFIRDAEKQQALSEEESLSGGQSTEERNLERARVAYEAQPSFPDAINRYAMLLKKQGTPEAVAKALHIYDTGFEATKEYRFRMAAGDIRIEQLEEALRQAHQAVEANPDDERLTAQRDQRRHALLETQLTEYTSRVAKYPTDRYRRFELGEVQVKLGRLDDAMQQFQSAKEEPKLHAKASQMLGRCFMHEKWFEEAIAEFEEALRAVEGGDKDAELVIRYDLMLALMAAAKAERSLDRAIAAKAICSDIARRNIAYRDIRQRRREVDEIITQLGGAAG